MAPAHPRSADFLELVERSQRGRLKVLLGYAAGVGKTYRMLEEAHALRARGVDVVIGVIETHGRADTAAMIGDLEHVPLRRFDYRGVTIDELDLDAVLARRPRVVLVDEVAHTNPPGARHAKRYEDVSALLDAGLNVICAFNVQHLQSLNDLVRAATGVAVRETIPDTFLQQADQVVTLDLDIDDLGERLRAGKIYAADKVDWALAHFFQPANLRTLRELTLREVAESVDRASGARAVVSTGSLPAASPAARSHVMVILSPRWLHSSAVVRRASRMAGRLNTDWYAVYVETPADAPELIDATEQRRLHGDIALARELGAEIVRLKARAAIPALLEFARSHRVAHLVAGRMREPVWRRYARRDWVSQLIDSCEELDVHIVGSETRRGDA